MTKELIVLTHNDLDALGCMLNLEYKTPSTPKKYFHTNYGNIDKIVNDILEYQKINSNTTIIIPDVSFSDNKESLRKLYTAFQKCIHIDHHMYPDGFWDEFPDMIVQWDKTKSATKICNEYFQNTGKVKNLDSLTTIIDVYDIWQKNDPLFAFAQDLNEYFWHELKSQSIEFLMNRIVENNYSLPNNFKEVVSNIKNEYNAKIQEYEKKGSIHRSGEITLCFIEEWFNQVMLDEHSKGVNFVVGINNYGITRIRVNQDSPYTEEQLNGIRFDLTGNAEYGHLHAFTYKTDGCIIDEAKRVTSAIIKNCS